MMNALFNSILENKLRVLILLSIYDMPQTLDMLYAVDFITVYGRTFGISDMDLNGDNEYKFSEFASRRHSVQEALRELVLTENVQAVNYKGSLSYVITPEGEDYCESLTSEYAKEYQANARAAVESVKGKSERSIISMINKQSAMSLREAVNNE